MRQRLRAAILSAAGRGAPGGRPVVHPTPPDDALLEREAASAPEEIRAPIAGSPERRLDGARERLDVPDGGEVGRSEDVGQAPDGGSGDRSAAGDRFDGGEALALGVRGKDEEIGPAVEVGQPLVTDSSVEPDASGEIRPGRALLEGAAARPLSDEVQHDTRVDLPDAREGVEEDVVSLDRNERSDVQERRGSGVTTYLSFSK